MKTSLTTLAALLALGLGSASLAHAAPAEQADPREAVELQAGDEASEAALKQRERACLRQTGTRIAPRGRADHERCVAGRSYDRQDIESTGERDIGQALRRLDPSIY